MIYNTFVYKPDSTILNGTSALIFAVAALTSLQI